MDILKETMDFSKGRGGKGRGRIEMWARGVAQVIA
jgi:hypothetical protein